MVPWSYSQSTYIWNSLGHLQDSLSCQYTFCMWSLLITHYLVFLSFSFSFFFYTSWSGWVTRFGIILEEFTLSQCIFGAGWSTATFFSSLLTTFGLCIGLSPCGSPWGMRQTFPISAVKPNGAWNAVSRAGIGRASARHAMPFSGAVWCCDEDDSILYRWTISERLHILAGIINASQDWSWMMVHILVWGVEDDLSGIGRWYARRKGV